MRQQEGSVAKGADRIFCNTTRRTTSAGDGEMLLDGGRRAFLDSGENRAAETQHSETFGTERVNRRQFPRVFRPCNDISHMQQ